MARQLKPFVNYNCALSDTQLGCLRQWAHGQFVSDYYPTRMPPGSLDMVPPAEQPAMLDRAALEFCLADAFHPGCEITWPIRHATMFMAPFRILSENAPPVDYGEVLTPDVATGRTGPLYGQAAGGLSRWMAVPWQADTASCRSGYDDNYDPYLPTFWPARVPNQILHLHNYRVAIDPSKSPKERHDAFNTRPNWYDAIPGYPDAKKQIAAMIHYWPFMGLVEQRPGATDDPDLPATMQISTDLPPRLLRTAPGAAVSDPATATATAAHARALAAPPAELSDEWAGRFAWRRDDAGN
jgi:L-lysine epsilon oxidase C-terminal domain